VRRARPSHACIHCRQTAFLDQLDNQLTVRDEVAYIVHYDRVWPLLRHFGEHALVLGRRRLLERHGDQRDIQPPADFPKPSSVKFPCPARQQERDF
jgi:hypothetical protein